MAGRGCWVLATVLVSSSGALGQATLYAVGANGDLIRLDPATGAGTLIGNSGVGCNGATADNAGHILTGGGNADQIIAIDPATGAGSVFLNTTGRPFGYGIRGMAVTPSNVLYVALSQADTTVIDTLATIDLVTGAYTVIGPTGRTDIQALASSPSGVLYAIGVNLGGRLYQLDPTTGFASVVGVGGGYGGDDQALEFLPDGSAFACRVGLRSVDLVTGTATLIGPTGFPDIRGMAMLNATPPPSCYANCDASTTPPVLNVQDFSCFLQKYAGADPYANCDASTTEPTLNVQDFTCFLQKFAAGCP
jgi:streptogramin lyase